MNYYSKVILNMLLMIDMLYDLIKYWISLIKLIINVL